MMKISSLKTQIQILAAAVGAIVSMASIAHAEPVIQVKPVVEIDSAKEEIVLGDIVEMHGVPDETARAIRGVRLADAPKPGEVRAFTDVGLQQLISNHIRGAGDIMVRVPSRVTVMKKTLRLKREEIENDLKAQFKQLCSDCDFEISGLSIPAIGERIPAGSSWKIRIRPELPRGSFSYPLEITNEDSTRRIFWISGTLAVRKTVPVSARAIGAGERVNQEDFIMQSKDITFSTDIAANNADFGSSLAGRMIPAGQIIWKNYLRREMAVKMGDPVKVMVGNDSWSITTEGVAQSSAYIGDSVRVKIPRTQKMVSGLLKEKGVVEVQ